MIILLILILIAFVYALRHAPEIKDEEDIE